MPQAGARGGCRRGILVSAGPEMATGQDVQVTLSDERRPSSGDQELSVSRRQRVAVSEDRAWFADEVAIDFPSIRDAIERTRRAFLRGEDNGGETPVGAEVLLSNREAFDGATVPLVLPVRTTCPLCGGRGESWMEWCGGCAGTGTWSLPRRVDLTLPPRTCDGTRFRFTITAPWILPTHVEVRIIVR
jgi:hypothetical protein